MLQRELSNLMHGYGTNTRGICKVYAMPKDLVLSMPNPQTMMGNLAAEPDCDFFFEEIVWKTGLEEWYEVSNDVNWRVEMTEEETETVNGPLFNYTVELVLPNDSFAKNKLLRTYYGKEWILIVHERTGAWRVLGSLYRGCVFQSKLTTGAIVAGANEYRCGFTWEQAQQPAYYTKAFNWQNSLVVSFNSVSSYNFRLQIDETVMITWPDDGTTVCYSTKSGFGGMIEVAKRMAIGEGSVNIYHRNQSEQFDMQAIVLDGIQWNGEGLVEISALPSTCKQIMVDGNIRLDNLPTDSFTNNLVSIIASNCSFDDAAIEAMLETLDGLGTTGGIFIGWFQNPAVVPTGDMALFKANLEAKAWTVSY